jgi:hypothetical protein
MKALAIMAILTSSMLLSSTMPAPAADEGKVKDATRQVESGAKAAGQGIVDTAKGVGSTVVEGAKVAGEKIKAAGKAAEPQARTAWDRLKDSAWSFGQSVKSFFTRLVGS